MMIDDNWNPEDNEGHYWKPDWTPPGKEPDPEWIPIYDTDENWGGNAPVDSHREFITGYKALGSIGRQEKLDIAQQNHFIQGMINTGLPEALKKGPDAVIDWIDVFSTFARIQEASFCKAPVVQKLAKAGYCPIQEEGINPVLKEDPKTVHFSIYEKRLNLKGTESIPESPSSLAEEIIGLFLFTIQTQEKSDWTPLTRYMATYKTVRTAFGDPIEGEGVLASTLRQRRKALTERGDTGR